MILKKKIIIGTVSLLIAIIIYSFLWGRLFPFSPIIIGFEQKEFNKAVIYYRKSNNVSKCITIDSLMNEVEDFHQLKFKKKAKIFVFNSDKEYTRRTGHKTRFVAFPLYGRIFVSAKAKKESEEGKIHMDVYLKHELSHSLLFQNMSLYHSCHFPGWLLEGIAVYNADQRGVDGYLTKEETLDKIRKGYFLNPDEWGTLSRKKGAKNFPLPNKYWFIYSEFACLVEDLIQNYGKEKFLQYMTELLEEKDDKKVFQRIFGIEFNEYVDYFKIRVGYNSE
ncbi:MAG: hypothetical protein ISS81_07785 [Candidatus Marinimicrobia bacterium]|nr:hypothetical protein [Candidatus Neomarinimicrobiota bacterium]